MLTPLQRQILLVSGLLGLGFISGVAVQSPTVQKMGFGADAAGGAQTRSSSLAAPSTQREIGQSGSVAMLNGRRNPDSNVFDCSDAASKSCRELRESYLRYMNRGHFASGELAPRDSNQAELGSRSVESDSLASDVRIVTVYHGATPAQYVVRREIN